MIRLIIRTHGSKWWLCDNQFHRVNGPAVVYDTGSLAWHNHGKLHRLDGPAVINQHGTYQYWINDRLVSEYEHMFLTKATYG